MGNENRYWVVEANGSYSIAFGREKEAQDYIEWLTETMFEVLAGPRGKLRNGIDLRIKIDNVGGDELAEEFICGCGECGSVWNPDKFLTESGVCPACGSELVDCQAQ